MSKADKHAVPLSTSPKQSGATNDPNAKPAAEPPSSGSLTTPVNRNPTLQPDEHGLTEKITIMAPLTLTPLNTEGSLVSVELSIPGTSLSGMLNPSMPLRKG